MLVVFKANKKYPRVKSSLQPDIDFSEAFAKPVRPTSRCKMVLNLVKSFEKLCYDTLICFLSAGNAAFVHAVVDVVVMPLVNFINLALQRLGIQRHVAIFWINDVVKLVLEIRIMYDRCSFYEPN